MTENHNDSTKTGPDNESAEPTSRTRAIYMTVRRVVWRFLRNTVFQPDFGVGAIVGVGVGFWAYYKHSVQLLEGVVLTTDIGASVGLLAVTLAAMTLILGFLQGFYKSLIRKVGGAKSFFYPFKVIAVVSGAAAISGLISSLDADSEPFRLSSILFGLSVGLLTWAIVGAVQLVFIFVRHGTIWLELDKALGPRTSEILIPDDLEGAEMPTEAPGPQARTPATSDQWQQGTNELTEQGHVTDRYTKAIEQLGSENLDVRIGGIYALERVAQDSAAAHSTVIEALAAFVREHSREPWPLPDHPAGQEQELSTRPDVQAAVTVIGRRDKEHDIRRIDLTGARLIRADLRAANLSYADLRAADLTGADLTGADLHATDLRAADLSGADLTGADLSGANLGGAKWPTNTPSPEGWGLDASGRLVKASPASPMAFLRKATGMSMGFNRNIITQADIDRLMDPNTGNPKTLTAKPPAG